MPESDPLDSLRQDIDYDKLIAQASPALQRYIRTLELENARLRQELMELRQSATRRQRAESARTSRSEAAPAQLSTIRYPDDVMVLTITARGLAKRTPLNDYSTQHRGGIGVFDIQTTRDDLVAHLAVARASAALLVLSSRGRAFRIPVDSLPLTEVRGRGASLPERLLFTAEETVATLLALDDEQDSRNTVLIATQSGWLRSLHRNYVGPRLQPGTLLSDPKRGGPPAVMTLSHGAGDVLLVLRSGLGYRFPERLSSREGVRGIQTRPDDQVVGLVSLQGDEDEVLLVTADGQGIRRQMAGFASNKSPGGQGKVIMKSDALAGAARVGSGDEALCISGFAKIIRFAADEAPAKSGNVQGVSILDTRGDSLAALAVVTPPAAAPAEEA
jgi:DNA gyrase subunit A